MSKACLVCNALYDEMINIFKHPKRLDFMINIFHGVEAQQNDFICKLCYKEVIKAFNYGQEAHQSDLDKPKVRNFADVAENENRSRKQDEIMVWMQPEVKFEPKSSGELEDPVGIGTSQFKRQEQSSERAEKAFGTFINVGSIAGDITEITGRNETTGFWNVPSIKVEPKSELPNNYQFLSLDSDFRQDGSDNIENFRVIFKKEKSVEIDPEEEKLNGGTQIIEIEDSIQLKEKSNIDDMLESIRKNSSKKANSPMIRFACLECGKGFAFIAHLKVHIRKHTNERPYKCSNCERGFATSSNLRRHEVVHAAERPPKDKSFKCTECGKGFETSTKLKIHVRAHTKEKPYVCSECGKGFITSTKLKIHIRLHTQDKPYACSECEKRFNTLYALKIHERIHTGERPFECPNCNKKCVTSTELRVHLRTHLKEKPYACSECGKDFVTATQLKIHISTHTKEKPHLCSECGTGFATLTRLKRHIERHGKKSFECSDCGRNFISMRSVKRHKRIVHPVHIDTPDYNRPPERKTRKKVIDYVTNFSSESDTDIEFKLEDESEGDSETNSNDETNEAKDDDQSLISDSNLELNPNISNITQCIREENQLSH